MQHRRSKRLKRVAAAILSAVLIVTELPQADLVFAAQEETTQTEVFTEEQIETESQEVSSAEQISSEAETTEAETKAPEQTSQTPETGTTESEAESESETRTPETETGTSELQTESQSETESVSAPTETESVEPETEAPETETTETTETETTETAETETTEEETTEMETTEIETTEEETEIEIPVPVVDTGVYEYKDLEFSLKKSNRISIQGMESLSLVETDGKYILNNKDEFLEFINSSDNYSGKTVELGCNIDMKNEVIGFSSIFSGTFDGRGHSIINFKTSRGLFREIGSSGIVQNLHISNASFDGESSAGIVVGINGGKIENILVKSFKTVVF